MSITNAIDMAAQVRLLVQRKEARRLREQTAEMSLLEAGRRCGDVYPQTIMRWENGERMPRGRNLRAYYRLLMQLAALDEPRGHGHSPGEPDGGDADAA